MNDKTKGVHPIQQPAAAPNAWAWEEKGYDGQWSRPHRRLPRREWGARWLT